jgi:hypothetical protein
VRIAVNALAGLIFGLGLLISGMANPAKVQNFLDLAGTFDPSLIFVMGGAVVVTFLGYRFAFTRPQPVLAEQFSLPTAKEIEARVVLGAGLFGIGWGLSGFCPGPAITSLPCSRRHARLCAGDADRHRRGASSSRRARRAKPPRPKRAKPSGSPTASVCRLTEGALPSFSLNPIE